MSNVRDIFREAGFGKVAPWVDLVNSEEWIGFGEFTDHLANPRWLATFLKHWELYPFPSKDVPRRKLEQLRSRLRRAAEKLAVGGSIGRSQLSALNQVLNVPAWQKLVQDQNGFRAETIPVRSNWTWVHALIAASFGEMLANQEIERIKGGDNSECRWVFQDPTQARTKRWCDDRTCGDRARVRRARARKRKA